MRQKSSAKNSADLQVVVSGSGAAGTATIKMLLEAGVRDVIPVDRSGALNRDDRYENSHWRWLAEHTNKENRRGTLAEVLAGADVFIGVSAPGILQPEHIASMARDPIIFAMANPTPEIMPDVAAPVAAVVATGRSDFPNQVNNLLAFPGIFRGALDVRARRITDEDEAGGGLRHRVDRDRRRAQRGIHHSERFRPSRRGRGSQGGRHCGRRRRRRTPYLGKERGRRNRNTSIGTHHA